MLYLEEAVGPGDAIEAENSHVKESEAQPSISHGVLHVSHPALVIVMIKLMVIGQSDGQKPTVRHCKCKTPSPALITCQVEEKAMASPRFSSCLPSSLTTFAFCSTSQEEWISRRSSSSTIPERMFHLFLSNVCSPNFWHVDADPPTTMRFLL